MSRRGLDSDEKKTIIEILETSIPAINKVVALMGKENYLTFVRVYNNWKKLLEKYYTKPINYDGKLCFAFLENVLAIIEQYFDLANSNYAEVVEDNATLITRLLSGTQAILISEMKGQYDVVPVKYDELAKNTELIPRTIAVKHFLKDETWTPKGNLGPVLLVEVYFMLDALAYAYGKYIESLIYHAKKRRNLKDDPNYAYELALILEQEKLGE